MERAALGTASKQPSPQWYVLSACPYRGLFRIPGLEGLHSSPVLSGRIATKLSKVGWTTICFKLQSYYTIVNYEISKVSKRSRV